ncbi:MAG TPA: ribosome silencing factor [Pyrinomonadaceae bacterium]|jgi:ribosome-associated protein|nr:ribosome silencing factor [Pyrinomonadaceae bacterium]
MSQKLKEKSLSPEVQAAAVGTRVSAGSIELSEFDDRVQRAINAAAEKKAIEPTVLDLRGISSFTDFFVIVTGANRRQVQAISDAVVDHLKRNGSPAARVEGYQTAEWVLIDYGDFVVHVFDDKARRFYDLERLWREARRRDLSPDDLTKLGSLRAE